MPRGRPIEPVVLTDDAAPQPRRSLPHGVVRRAQIVLACAQGEANASIARRMHATVGKWRKRYRMQGIEGLHDTARGPAQNPSMNGSPRSSTPRNQTTRWRHPLERAPWPSKAASPRAPCNAGSVSPSNPTASATSSSPSSEARYRRPLSQPARPRRRAVCRRENPGPGAQPHPTDAADGAGLRRRGHPRLRPSRHHHPVRRPRHRHRTGVREAPSPPGVSRLPTAPTSPNRSTFTSSPTTTPPTSTRRSELGSQGDRDTTSTTHPPMPRGSTRSSAGSASSLKRPFDAARSPTSANW